MKLSHQQITNNAANQIVTSYENLAQQIRALLTEGGKVGEEVITADELKAALYDNLAKVEAVTALILD